MIQHKNTIKYYRVLKYIFIIFLLITFWQLAVTTFSIPDYLFPTPFQVFHRFIANWASYFSATSTTLFEAICGLFLALVLTTCLGICFALSKTLEQHVSTALVAMQSIPILALAPLLTMWFGPGFFSKVVASLLVCFFPLAASWSSGIQSVSNDEKELFYTMNASRLQVVRWLIIPRSLPFFFGGLKVAAPLSILGAIVGEFVGAIGGIGFLILSHSYYARTADMFVCIFIVALAGIVSYKIVVTLERKIVFWQDKNTAGLLGK